MLQIYLIAQEKLITAKASMDSNAQITRQSFCERFIGNSENERRSAREGTTRRVFRTAAERLIRVLILFSCDSRAHIHLGIIGFSYRHDDLRDS